jgi:hypothetical protein
LVSGCRRELLLETSKAWLDLSVRDSLTGSGRVASGELYEMRVFGAEDGIYRSSSFVRPDGGEVSLPAGTYDILVTRFDNQTVVFDGESRYETLRAYTRDAAASSKALFNELATEVLSKATEQVKASGDDVWEQFLTGAVAWEPGWFFAGKSEGLAVPVRDVQEDIFRFPVTAYLAVQHCRLTVTGLRGQKNISGVTCFLTGLARGVYLATGSPDFEPVTMMFMLPKGGEGEPMTTDFSTFGFVPDAVAKARAKAAAAKGGPIELDDLPETRNVLFILITDTGGGNYLFTADVTDQCKTPSGGADDPVTLIEIDLTVHIDFEVPEPEHGGGGLEPTVAHWDEITYVIDLG